MTDGGCMNRGWGEGDNNNGPGEYEYGNEDDADDRLRSGLLGDDFDDLHLGP
jgi:hypothetical protein